MAVLCDGYTIEVTMRAHALTMRALSIILLQIPLATDARNTPTLIILLSHAILRKTRPLSVLDTIPSKISVPAKHYPPINHLLEGRLRVGVAVLEGFCWRIRVGTRKHVCIIRGI